MKTLGKSEGRSRKTRKDWGNPDKLGQKLEKFRKNLKNLRKTRKTWENLGKTYS